MTKDSKDLPPEHKKGQQEKRDDIRKPHDADETVDAAEEQAQLDVRSTSG